MAAKSSIESQTEEAKVNRYQVDRFKPTNAKALPLEQLDFSIYKPTNLVAFSTTEERLPLWIKAMDLRYKDGFVDDKKLIAHWEEQNNADDPSKCDKVTITLTSKENDKNIIVITVMVDKGRIQVQSRFIKEWSSEEFPTLMELIDNPALLENQPTKNLKNFVNKISTPSSSKHQRTVASQPSDHNTSIHSSTERPSTAIKTNLASLEADFIEFKQNTN